MQDFLTPWNHPYFWDFVGILILACFLLKAAARFLLWWYKKTDRKDVYWTEFFGGIFGGLICAFTLFLRVWLEPNLAGALLFNGAIAFVLKVTAVQIIGTWIVHTEERIKRGGEETVPISVIENNTVLPALSRSLWAAAGAAAVLANGDVEPTWLGHWVVIAIVSVMVCTYVTKIESTHTVTAIWNQLNKPRYK